MIQERFLQSACNIRRVYLRVSSNLEHYHQQTKKTLEVLEQTVVKIDQFKDSVKKMDEKEGFLELIKILTDVEEEGKSIEKMTEPINREIEKLGQEEKMLYQQIRVAHPQLSEDQIVKSVEERLQAEGLI